MYKYSNISGDRAYTIAKNKDEYEFLCEKRKQLLSDHEYDAKYDVAYEDGTYRVDMLYSSDRARLYGYLQTWRKKSIGKKEYERQRYLKYISDMYENIEHMYEEIEKCKRIIQNCERKLEELES